MQAFSRAQIAHHSLQSLMVQGRDELPCNPYVDLIPEASRAPSMFGLSRTELDLGERGIGKG